MIPNAASTTTISGTDLYDGASTVQFISGSSAWDGAMVKNLNYSTFDWWYFDVLAEDGQSSAVLTFYTACHKCLFPEVQNTDTAVGVSASVTTPDGSFLEATVLSAEMTVDTIGGGSIGWYPDGSALWAGTLDLSAYTLQFNAPQSGITGNVTMFSTAPAHLPCAPTSAGAGQSLKLGDTLGWFNAIPDSTAYVNLDMNGTRVQFSGHGYHDLKTGVQYPYPIPHVSGTGATPTSGPTPLSGSSTRGSTAKKAAVATSPTMAGSCRWPAGVRRSGLLAGALNSLLHQPSIPL